jgi:hypothetical protein
MRPANTVFAIAVLAAAGVAALPAAASANLVQNGDFSSLTGPSNQFIGYPGYTQINDWSYGNAPNPNAAVYDYAGADSFPGAPQGPYGNYPLYGPGTGYNNGFVAPPGGSNFLASDGEAAYSAPISQTVSGLIPGQTYLLSFTWAGNQFLDSSSESYNGDISAAWQVSLGTETFTTPSVTFAAHGFTGWMTQTFLYTASSTSETLSFLAEGTPNGLPPVALLDGVSLIPEPANWSVILLGIAGVGAVTYRRRRAAGVA